MKRTNPQDVDRIIRDCARGTLYARDLTDDQLDTITRALGLPDEEDTAAGIVRSWSPVTIAQYYRDRQ